MLHLALAAMYLLAGAAVAANRADSFRDCAECPPMVAIPAGAFDMGSSPDERRREGVPAITRSQYARFAAATGRAVAADCQTYNAKADSWVGNPAPASWQQPGFAQGDDHPVVCMTWNDARDYATWLASTTGKHYRLATEAEWEYAARGGSGTARYWGDDLQGICSKVHMMSSATVEAIGMPPSWTGLLVCTGRQAWTVPTGSFPPNPFGLHDMLGSVWEWTADCAHPNYNGAPADGSAWIESGCDHHQLRGGALHSQYWLVRSAIRGSAMESTYRPLSAGIRVARDLE
jgi:formylglycine-generating enzyme